MEVRLMCLYQHMTCVVAKIWKYVWLTGNNWIIVKKVVFSSIFMEVNMEVNDLRSQIFFVIFVDDQNLRLNSKISAFYLNYVDQT